MKKLVMLFACLLVMMHANAYDFKKVSVNTAVDIMGNYNFRGFNLGGLSLQPWIDFSAYGFTVGAWGNIGSGKGSDFNVLVPELDIYLMYATPKDIFTIKLTHMYYFSGKFFSLNYDEPNLSTSQTEIEAWFTLSQKYPVVIGAAVQIGGGDCYSLATGDVIYGRDGKPKRMFSTYIYVNYNWQINENVSWLNEIGFSSHESCYTYYSKAANGHASFALNNLSSLVMWSFMSNNVFSLRLIAELHLNLFDIGYEAFAYGKNFGWNVGFGFQF